MQSPFRVNVEDSCHCKGERQNSQEPTKDMTLFIAEWNALSTELGNWCETWAHTALRSLLHHSALSWQVWSYFYVQSPRRLGRYLSAANELASTTAIAFDKVQEDKPLSYKEWTTNFASVDVKCSRFGARSHCSCHDAAEPFCLSPWRATPCVKVKCSREWEKRDRKY